MHTNAIYCGDCQRVLGNTVEFPDESVDLIYADPPFFTSADYEVLWGDGYELRAFEDRWKGGVENYIAWMEPKLRECHRVLKRTGSLYLHCDPHANAYLRVLLDRIFGESHFQNEIVWDIAVLSGFKVQAKRWVRGHDTIYFYTKGTEFTFNKQFVPHRQEYIDRFNKVDAKGRKYFDGRGTRRYLDDVKAKGKPVGDVWSDIMSFQQTPTAKEKLGYPTQKPEALLERIIRASSDEGDVVLDPFCGCGTAIAVAQRLKRLWVGVDVSPTACKLMAKRMHSLGVAISERDVIGMPKTLREIHAMQPFEFQNWVIQKLMGRVSARKTGDMGIDGYLFDGTPVQVKQSENVGRNVVDNFETAIRRAKKSKGLIVAFSFGKGAHEEAARVKNAEGLDILLKTTQELLEEE